MRDANGTLTDSKRKHSRSEAYPHL